MKQLLLAITLLSLCACSKGGNTPPAAETPNFTITGIRDADFSTTSGNTISFNISVTADPGTADTVFLYANELPGGLFVDFSPIYGVAPFTSKVSVRTYASDAKTYSIKVNGAGRSGVRTYNLNVTQPGPRGWQIGTETFNRERVEKKDGVTGTPSEIRCVSDNGAQLILTFAEGAPLPTGNSTYTIAEKAISQNSITLTHSRGIVTYYSTGAGSAGNTTGTFTVDGNGKLNFKCANVNMADTTVTKSLSANFGE